MNKELSTLSLGQIGSVRMCKRVLKEQTSESEEIPFFKISTFGDKPDTYISKELFEEYVNKYSYPQKGDILISAAGTLGKIVIFDGKPSYFQDSNIVWIENDEKKLINEYLYYFYKTNPWETTNGSTINRIYNDNLRNIKVTFPKSIQVQQKIAKVLSDLDAKIELNNRINAELEAMAKLVYEYWFVQFDFPRSLSGVEGNVPSTPLRDRASVAERSRSQPYKSSGGKMVWNEELKREIPEGWRSGTISDIASLTRGVTYNKDDIKDESTSGTIPILRATNITGNQIDLGSMVYVSESLVDEEQILKPFDILITMSSGSIDHIGKNGFYLFKEKVAFGAFCAKIEAKEDFEFYLYSYTQSDFFFTTIKNECLGTNINNLNGSMVKGFKMVIPDNSTLIKFNDHVKPLFEKIKINANQNRELSTLRDWLLPMLMNGQVSIYN